MKGIVLAGGSGSRLFPITKGCSKQLLPIFDKPMIYYPISVLFLSDIKEILIISTPKDIESYRSLLGNGDRFGVRFQYAIQDKPSGLAQAFHIGENFIGNDSVALILGDNIFYGSGFAERLSSASKLNSGAQIFAYHVKDPQRFGVVEFENDIAKSIEEKPLKPKSNYAVTGLYFFDNNVVKISKKIKPSDRGELEITDINKIYLKEGSLTVNKMGRGYAWFDTGTIDSYLDANIFIQSIETRQNLKVGCLEEIAYRKGWINIHAIIEASKNYSGSSYGEYLSKIL